MGLNIVILDGQLANPGDLSWSPIEQYGKVTVYHATRDHEIVPRSKQAQVIIVNKVKLNKYHFDQLPGLKLICLLATGYDNINLIDAEKAGIVVCNAVAYGVNSVAQHVFALLLACYNKVYLHNSSVQQGEWTDRQWSYTVSPLRELDGKILGIYGFGKIGRRVSEIARSFGLKVLSHHKHPERDATEGIEFVSLEKLFRQCDIISLHAPLSASNKEIVNKELLSLMKPDAVLINTGRGGLIHEEDLRAHLLSFKDTTAALDVLSVEPPGKSHPLIGLDNCIITPHNAWATKEARFRLIHIVGKNIEGFMKGKPVHVVHA